MSENKYKVYVHTCTLNDKKYVGVTGNSLNVRKGRNWEGYRGSPYFYRAIQKYGSSNFVSEIIWDGLTKEQASIKEKELIELYDTRNPEKGFNLHRGGYRTSEVFEEGISREQKISDTLKKQRSTNAYKKIMAERMKKVWDDPVRREKMLQKRANNPSKAGKNHNAKYRGFVWDDGSPILDKKGKSISTIAGLARYLNVPVGIVANSVHTWLSKKQLKGMLIEGVVYIMRTTEDDKLWMLKKVNCWDVLELPITDNGMDIGGWIISSRAAKGLKFRIRALAEGSTTIPSGSTLK